MAFKEFTVRTRAFSLDSRLDLISFKSPRKRASCVSKSFTASACSFTILFVDVVETPCTLFKRRSPSCISSLNDSPSGFGKSFKTGTPRFVSNNKLLITCFDDAPILFVMVGDETSGSRVALND